MGSRWQTAGGKGELLLRSAAIKQASNKPSLLVLVILNLVYCQANFQLAGLNLRKSQFRYSENGVLELCQAATIKPRQIECSGFFLLDRNGQN